MDDSRTFLDRVRQSRMRRYWTRKLNAGAVTDDLRKDARKLRRILDEIERSGDAFNQIQTDPKEGLPTATLWANRPEPWSIPIKATGPVPLSSGTKLAQDTTLYHDGKSGEVLAKQANGEFGGAFDLSLDVADFDGDYISLALALPAEQIKSVQRTGQRESRPQCRSGHARNRSEPRQTHCRVRSVLRRAGHPKDHRCMGRSDL